VSQELGGVSRRQLGTLFSVGVTAGLTDGQLLERFATGTGAASEMAFGALVERHGPMVLRTCRGVLRDAHEADDAFQATFLILVRKRGTLWVRDSLGPWLHRVACRAARRARVAAVRRREIERKAGERPGDRSTAPDLADLAAILHEEVDRLPERYRAPVVLCDLEGRSQEDAARHLGCPAGTIKSRLARGRDRLRRRLLRRGLVPTTVLSAACAGGAVEGSVVLPDVLTESTIQSAIHLTSAAATGAVPTSVAELTEDVLKMMFHGKLKLVAAGLFTAAGLAVAVGSWAQQATKEPPPAAPPRQVREPVVNRRWTRSFPNGATIEVLGISPYPSAPGSWWAPDGTPLAEAPCDPGVKPFTGNENDVYRAVAVRITGEPEGADVDWSVSGKGYTKERATRAGKDVPGLRLAAVLCPRNLEPCTVTFSVAAGPWKTVETANIRTGAFGTGLQKKMGCIFSDPFPTRAGVLLAVTYRIQVDEVRLVAVDREGKERSPLRSSGASTWGFYQVVSEFDLTPDQVAEFRLQTRSYEHLEIKDVALRPSGDL
jgi:RNA polymerase sigma factor (sigma-70 family)